MPIDKKYIEQENWNIERKGPYRILIFKDQRKRIQPKRLRMDARMTGGKPGEEVI